MRYPSMPGGKLCAKTQSFARRWLSARRRSTALGAALVLALGGLTVAASPALAQDDGTAGEYVPEWDELRPPSRPQEYRTDTTDTFMRLSPYFGLYQFGHDLELKGQIKLPGSNRKRGSGNLGIRLEFEPADVMFVTFDLGFGGNLVGKGWSASLDRDLTDLVPALNPGATAASDVPGKLIHLAGYLGLKNPELKFGPIQPVLGVGLGAFYLFDYDRSVIRVRDSGGQLVDVDFVPYEDTWLVHASLFLRFDVDLGERFAAGIDIKVHFPLYAAGDEVGLMAPDEFDFSLRYTIFEPTLYFSVRF